MHRTRHLKRGIYILPTLFTVGNLFCGYTSVVQSGDGRLELAALLILLAAILDALDGRIARLTGTSSRFGMEFDSLADIVSFGIAPALLAYRWGLEPLGRVGWLAAFLYVVCAAMRLARYNTKATVVDRRYFVGLPSPMAGGTLALTVLAFPHLVGARWLPAAFSLCVIGVATLMISRLRYRSLGKLDHRGRRPYRYVLAIAIVLVAVALHPRGVLLLLSTAYLLYAPVLYGAGWLSRGRIGSGRTAAAAPAAPTAEAADEPFVR